MSDNLMKPIIIFTPIYYNKSTELTTIRSLNYFIIPLINLSKKKYLKTPLYYAYYWTRKFILLIPRNFTLAILVEFKLHSSQPLRLYYGLRFDDDNIYISSESFSSIVYILISKFYYYYYWYENLHSIK
jgi:hypothetical protein